MKLIRLTPQNINLTHLDLVKIVYRYLSSIDQEVYNKETYIHYAEIPNGEKCVYIYNQIINDDDKVNYIASFDNIYACFRVSGFIVIFGENSIVHVLMNSSYEPQMHLAGFSISDDSIMLISTDIFDYLLNLDWH